MKTYFTNTVKPKDSQVNILLLLVYEIANYNLKLHSRREDMSKHNIRPYALSQKYFSVVNFERKVTHNDVKFEPKVHNLPRYSFKSLYELYKYITKTFYKSRERINQLEIQLNNSKQKLKDIKYVMALQEFEQDQYFEKEKNILEQIGTFVNVEWELNKKHR